LLRTSVVRGSGRRSLVLSARAGAALWTAKKSAGVSGWGRAWRRRSNGLADQYVRSARPSPLPHQISLQIPIVACRRSTARISWPPTPATKTDFLFPSARAGVSSAPRRSDSPELCTTVIRKPCPLWAEAHFSSTGPSLAANTGTGAQSTEPWHPVRAESQTLDFKFCLPGKDEPSKVEFAKDVCAFANADGGEIVFGESPCWIRQVTRSEYSTRGRECPR
jgi:hypothetical protein